MSRFLHEMEAKVAMSNTAATPETYSEPGVSKSVDIIDREYNGDVQHAMESLLVSSTLPPSPESPIVYNYKLSNDHFQEARAYLAAHNNQHRCMTTGDLLVVKMDVWPCEKSWLWLTAQIENQRLELAEHTNDPLVTNYMNELGVDSTTQKELSQRLQMPACTPCKNPLPESAAPALSPSGKSATPSSFQEHPDTPSSGTAEESGMNKSISSDEGLNDTSCPRTVVIMLSARDNTWEDLIEKIKHMLFSPWIEQRRGDIRLALAIKGPSDEDLREGNREVRVGIWRLRSGTRGAEAMDTVFDKIIRDKHGRHRVSPSAAIVLTWRDFLRPYLGRDEEPLGLASLLENELLVIPYGVLLQEIEKDERMLALPDEEFRDIFRFERIPEPTNNTHELEMA
ncbi:hypothetical protein M406DRAFT_335205 [Cryphonectria parasitica EP155]|uniref:Uncharacterized protein n=1 Tax=Cryphonectria parasitica (strain ATCC 38755 / EP155) TaxID=660469 RepID=A0A9P5CHJ4_CRYP1|nr:uncharacterized protein M406DRAFT_335205 [Cryphonectria parasitica EP155]KAF3759993.1 hypothetical protein M406DRAFT_335205 [Cryphonectria parasitica EP155]